MRQLEIIEAEFEEIPSNTLINIRRPLAIRMHAASARFCLRRDPSRRNLRRLFAFRAVICSFASDAALLPTSSGITLLDTSARCFRSHLIIYESLELECLHEDVLGYAERFGKDGA